MQAQDTQSAAVFDAAPNGKNTQSIELYCDEQKAKAKALYSSGAVREAMQHWRHIVQVLSAQGHPAADSYSGLAAAMRARCHGRSEVR